jgi:hypothetical protein
MKIKSALTAVAVIALVASFFNATGASADTVTGTSGDFSYEVTDGAHATITNYFGFPTTLTIPETLGGYPVTAIANGIFAYRDLTAVTLPRQLTTIGSEAFWGNLLTTVMIPATVTSIGERAFKMPGLESVLFLGDAPTVTAAGTIGGPPRNQRDTSTFDSSTVNFSVTYISGNTTFGTGDTWHGYPLTQPAELVTSTSSVTVNVTPGVRSAGLTSAAFDSLLFAHARQTQTTGATLSVDDLTGANAGWNVTVSSSVLTWTASSGGPLTGSDLPASALAITTVGDITTVAGDDWTGITNLGALDSPVKVLSTSGGNGSYTAPLTLTLTVPGQASVGTYAGTLTTTISAAP